jgi:hypothetical protein
VEEVDGSLVVAAKHILEAEAGSILLAVDEADAGLHHRRHGARTWAGDMFHYLLLVQVRSFDRSSAEQ